jgi:hypothetical protein
MSKSLRIVNGDLSVGAGRAFETVSGAEKLAQDLRLWILEKIGTDPATPGFGSRLDGGAVDGQQIESFIGQIGSLERLNEVKAEINTLLSLYQATQIQKMQRDIISSSTGRHTLSSDEILQTVESIEAAMTGTTIVVRVIIKTMAGTAAKVTIPVEV